MFETKENIKQEESGDIPSFIKRSDVDEFIERYELKRLHTDVFERVLIFVIAGLGLISALAWDDALKHAFVRYFGSMESTSLKVLYAAILTLGTVLITIGLNKMMGKKRE